jgi:integrase
MVYGRVEGKLYRKVFKSFELVLADKQEKEIEAVNGKVELRNLRGRTKGLLAAHGPLLVNEITPADVTALIHKPTWSPRQSSNERRVLTNFFGWAVRQKYAPENPCDAVETLVIERSRIVILPLADVRNLLETALTFAGGALVPFTVLSLFCGLRPSEVARLKWSDIDLDAGTVNIDADRCKTRTRR